MRDLFYTRKTKMIALYSEHPYFGDDKSMRYQKKLKKLSETSKEKNIDSSHKMCSSCSGE